jgi:glycine/D-amino acid oxidase-like deaminating enzyme
MVDGALGGYASSGNQGWLHNGALYAAHGSPSLVRYCRDGTRDISRLAAEHKRSFTAADGASLYGVESLEERDEILRRLANAEVSADPVPSHAAKRISPLANSRHHYVVSSDAPIDTVAVLSALWAGARDRGADLVDLVDLAATSCVRTAGGWSIRVVTGQRLRARAVVLALGGATPEFAARMGYPAAPAVERTLSRVLVVHLPVPPVIVVSLRRVGPHAVPVLTQGASPRFTVCLPFDNDRTRARDRSVEAPEVTGMLVRCPELLQPLRDLLQRRASDGVPLSLYLCEKVQGVHDKPGTVASRTPRINRLASDCFCLHAGKFTIASLAAKACLEQLIEEGLVPQAARGAPGRQPYPSMPRVAIAPRNALAGGQFMLRSRKGRLSVEPIG